MNLSVHEARVSVTVGFSQATTPLLGPTPGTTQSGGAAADGASDGSGGLFAALLALLNPAASAPETDAPPAPDAALLPQPDLPLTEELGQLTSSAEGKALLKDFDSAIRAAKQAIQDGKPLDPALEKKLTETTDAIAAWLGTLPPEPAAAAETSLDEIPVTPASPAAVQARIVPEALARLGNALNDFAAELEKLAPELAKALATLGGRVSVGDISDDALTQLGLTRTTDSSSPELDQLVAALTATRPQAKPPAAQAPFTPPSLELPKLTAEKAEASRSESLDRPDDPQLDAQVKIDAGQHRPKDKPPVATAHASAPVEAKAEPASTAPAATPDAAPQPPPAASVAPAAAARAIHAAYAAPVQQLNLPQVAFELVRQFDAGNTRFQLRLDPPELGRIDVRLDLDKHGTVNARMFVERPETLDLMLRDQRALQQALQQAGLDASKTNLEFSLRQSPFAGTGADTGQGGGDAGQPDFGTFGTPAAEDGTEPAASTYRGTASASGINLFV